MFYSFLVLALTNLHAESLSWSFKGTRLRCGTVSLDFAPDAKTGAYTRHGTHGRFRVKWSEEQGLLYFDDATAPLKLHYGRDGRGLTYLNHSQCEYL